MRILVIGGGGREHALVWKITQSPLVEKIYCAPGNAGIAQIAECVPLKVTDVEGLANFAESQKIDLTVVGPEAPLIAGIVDRFTKRGLKAFGPSAAPAQLEGSKAFAKQVMQSAGIPTAGYWICDSLAEAQGCVKDYFVSQGAEAKIVVKADGIAAGKGVMVVQGEAAANEALLRTMGDRIFGASGDRVVLEECLEGEEASIMAITDGETVIPLVPSQDHKRIFEGDKGPNTGGMGAYTPVPVIPANTVQVTLERVLKPAVQAMKAQGTPYRGILYAGIIVTTEGPKCIEFNCRLGDPETEAVLPMLESDLVPLLLRSLDGSLGQAEVRWREGASVCVVAASGGYPGDYKTGKPIAGLEQVATLDDTLVFHAGTRFADDKVVTDGGRVLVVTGLGSDLPAALSHAYTGLSQLHFEGIYYRRDIAARVLKKG